MYGLVITAVGLVGQIVPIAYSSFVDLEKREADPAFFQTYSVGSTSNNFDCKYGGCRGGGFELVKSETLPQSLGYTNGYREALPVYGYGKREASFIWPAVEYRKREASLQEGGLGYDLNGNRLWPDERRKREASPRAQFTQFNDAATFQNFDCNPLTGCQLVGSNIPSPVRSLPQRVTSPPRQVVKTLSTRVTNPPRKVESNLPQRIISRPTVTNSPSGVVVDIQPESDECKCDFGQMVVFVGYDYFECSSISTSEDGSVCFYKNSSDEDTSCKCG